MTDQLVEIGRRLAGLREIMQYTPADMAQKLNVSEAEYARYERGEVDFSFSFLYNAAGILNVDVFDLISGESPKLSSYSLVRAGQGYSIERRKAYGYKHLAYTFRDKKAEPFLVTVEPKPDDGEPTPHSHEGQEFNYVLSGRILVRINEQVLSLGPGDSLYYDSTALHSMQAEGETAVFLAVVIK
ncbi:MAG: XRE family transcriptional regulator [Dehalococcoidia bacterium]|nr:XRE family transcriptional regulator [Dehalococcoidia bacterium]